LKDRINKFQSNSHNQINYFKLYSLIKGNVAVIFTESEHFEKINEIVMNCKQPCEAKLNQIAPNDVMIY
jgi:ribosomal protein L10